MLGHLSKKSAARVAKSKRFQNIRQSVEMLKSNREDTKIPMSLAAMKKRRLKGRKDVDRFKFNDVDKSIIISHVSLDQKLLSEDQKTRKQEWIQGLKKDPYITETLSHPPRPFQDWPSPAKLGPLYESNAPMEFGVLGVKDKSLLKLKQGIGRLP